MAKTVQTDAVWNEVDVDTLPGDIAEGYKAYKASYLETKAIREAFEKQMNDMSPEGKRMIFGYRFGKLSIAIVDATDVKASKPKAAKLSLKEFMAQQVAAGGRV